MNTGNFLLVLYDRDGNCHETLQSNSLEKLRLDSASYCGDSAIFWAPLGVKVKLIEWLLREEGKNDGSANIL